MRSKNASPYHALTEATSTGGSRRDAETDTVSCDIVTSSCGDKISARSATKAILEFEGNLWLKLPKLGRKAMLGMMEGREIARLDTAMVQWEGRQALL